MRGKTGRGGAVARAVLAGAVLALTGAGAAGAWTADESVTVDGLRREYHVALPDDAGPAPGAVLVFHGGGGTGAAMLEQNPMTAAAEAGGFLAVFPEGIDGHWTDGRASRAGGPDDVAFVRAMVAQLVADHGVDPDRVFATGMSNGAIFTYRLACDAPGLVRAIAPVAGTMPADYMPRCAPAQGTPVMMFNGTDDGLMPYGGGRPERSRLIGLFRGEVDEMVSAPETLAFWARMNGCGGPQRETALPDATADGTTVTRIALDCGAATLFRIEGGGHTWPGSTAPRVAPRLTGTVSMDIDATATMVAFFRAWGL